MITDDLIEVDVEASETYNSNIRNLDETYTSIKPLRDTIVRVFVIEPEVKDGIVIPHKEVVQIPTSNGMGTLYDIPSPYPYSTKAIVVSTASKVLQAGDIVQLASNYVIPSVIGGGNEATIRIKNAYLHPDSNLTMTPTSMRSKHYGYLLVPEYDIVAKL